jgi:membrane-associated protease RseP (regulator of RpoE activity)
VFPPSLGDILVSVVLYAFLFVWILVLLIPERELEKRGIERSPLTLIFRSKKGLETINREAKKREKFFKKLGSFAVSISAPLILLVFVGLLLNTAHILTTPDSDPGIRPLLPEGVVDIEGAIPIPWEYWLLSVITILIAHEIMHGLVARAEDVPLKSLGIFSVTFVPLGAFVEPDDEELEKKAPMSKFRMYAAGSMGNFIAAVLGALVLLSLLIVVTPLAFQGSIIQITNVTAGSPAEKAGIQTGMVLLGIDNMDIESVEDFREAVPNLKPGVPVVVRTDNGEFTVVPEKREGFKNGFIGIAIFSQMKAKPYVVSIFGEEGAFSIYVVAAQAFYWIAVLNFLVGLTNLLPIMPLDGGRMFVLFMEQRAAGKAKGIITFFNLLLLALVIINIGPYFGLFQGVL